MNIQTALSTIMTTKLQTVEAYQTLENVARIFDRFEVHHVPVIDDKGKLAGIISKSDFLKISFGISLFSNPQRDNYNAALYKTTLVKDIMTKMVVSLGPEDTVETAARIFRENLFHALPIVQHGKLVGLVTTYDLLNFAYKPDNLGSIEGKAYLNTIE